MGLLACYLGSLTCPSKLSRHVPEVETSTYYSPTTDLPLILCTWESSLGPTLPSHEAEEYGKSHLQRHTEVNGDAYSYPCSRTGQPKFGMHPAHRYSHSRDAPGLPQHVGGKRFQSQEAGETGRLSRAQECREILGMDCFPHSVLEGSYFLWYQKSLHNELPGEDTKTPGLTRLEFGCIHVKVSVNATHNMIIYKQGGRHIQTKKQPLNLWYASIKQNKNIFIQKRAQLLINGFSTTGPNKVLGGTCRESLTGESGKATHATVQTLSQSSCINK